MQKIEGFSGRSATTPCNSGSAGSRACVSQKGRRSCRSTVVTSSCLRVNLVWSRFNFLDGWRASVSGALRFSLDQLVWPGVYSVYRLMNGLGVRTQTTQTESIRTPDYTTLWRPRTPSLFFFFFFSPLLLVTTTLESISGPLSHAEWERLILNIWQPCL